MEPVTIELGGKQRRLALDMNGQIAILERTGMDAFTYAALLNKLTLVNGKPVPPPIIERLKIIRTLIWGMAVSHSPELESDPHGLQVVGSWIDLGSLPELAQIVAQVIERYSEGLTKLQVAEFEGQMARFVATPLAVVSKMIELAEIKAGDGVIDLGAGDGRLMFAAIDAGAETACGYEMEPGRYAALAEKIKGRDGMHVEKRDIREAQVSGDDVIFLYLTPAANAELKAKLLAECEVGARIVSHDFAMPDWVPDRTEYVEADDRVHTVHMWRIPERVAS